jgi:hypothetical protein
MIIAHYGHRLPADYDMPGIRARAAKLGPQWNNVPELYFKGFLLREQGRHGAAANNYSSLYLWRLDEAFRGFLTGDQFRSVLKSFGRPEIQTRVALDARQGNGRTARFAYKMQTEIPLDLDLNSACAAEIDLNRETASRTGTVAAAVGIDTQSWMFTRLLLSENEPSGNEAGTCYEVLYLAAPLLSSLPQAGGK